VIELVGKGEEMQAGAGIAEGELITGQMEAAEMLPEASSQDLLVRERITLGTYR